MNEVWIFRGTKPVVWRIPVKIVFQQDPQRSSKRQRAILQPAVPLLGCQRQALDQHFQGFKAVENIDGRWRIKGHVPIGPCTHTRGRSGWRYEVRLSRMGGCKITADDPEDHLVWGARRPPDSKAKPESKERREWLADLLARGVGDSLEQLEYFWRAFCLHIAHTLINREAPVDCHYFRLHNCPLRADWMDYIGRPAPYKAVNLMRHAMEGSRIMAMDIEGQHCLRHIELEHTAKWWNLVGKAESQRRRAAGPEKYARNFQGSLERFAPTAWALFWSHRKEMVQAHARRVSHGHRGGFRLVPDPMARNVYGAAYHIVRSADKPTLKSLREAIAHTRAALSRAHGRVPAVSDLRPAAQVVRKPQGDGHRSAVDQPGDGARGGDGVLVRDDLGGVVPDETLLVARAGVDGDGMAAGT